MYGLKIFGDNGLQIDENYISLALVAKGTAVANIDYGQNGYSKYYKLTVSGTYPMIAVRKNAGADPNYRKGAVIFRTERSDNQWTFYVMVYNDTFPIVASGFNFEYWVYDAPPATLPSGDTHGLIVKTQDSRVTFNSSWPALDLSSSNNSAYIAKSGISYTENMVWDSKKMQELYYYEYGATFAFTKSDGSVSSQYVILDGGASYQPPSYPYVNGGSSIELLVVNVSRQ